MKTIYKNTSFVLTLFGESEDQILNKLCTPHEIGEIAVEMTDTSGFSKMLFKLNGESVSEEKLKYELFRAFKMICKTQVARNNQHIEKYRQGFFSDLFKFQCTKEQDEVK